MFLKPFMFNISEGMQCIQKRLQSVDIQAKPLEYLKIKVYSNSNQDSYVFYQKHLELSTQEHEYCNLWYVKCQMHVSEV